MQSGIWAAGSLSDGLMHTKKKKKKKRGLFLVVSSSVLCSYSDGSCYFNALSTARTVSGQNSDGLIYTNLFFVF